MNAKVFNMENREFEVFEIFKGEKDESGRVKKKRLLGQATLLKGTKTYTLFIKTLLDTRFYLLPENRNPEKYEYVILTREPSKVPERRFFWSSVGEGKILMGANKGLLHLEWDFLGGKDIYMNLEAKEDRVLKSQNGEL